jgi:HlyD family secretion protein
MVLTGCAGLGGQPTPPPATAAPELANPASLPPIQSDNRVVADGVIAPQRHAELSLPAAGVVVEVLAAEGQPVAAGDVVLRLDSARQRAGLAQAEANLASVEARLAELRAGPRPEEVVSAQAAVDAVQAQLDRLQEGARPQEIAAAQAALDGAQAALQKVLEGPSQSQLIAAETDLANAAAALAQAQAAYDRVAGNPDIGRRPEALQLQQATNNRNAAQARLDALKASATAADIAAAQAQVRQAQAQLDSLQAPARASDMAAAQAELRRAEAQLAMLAAGARPETVAAVEAEVVAAKAATAQAQAALADTELRAPFAGAVVELLPAVGELVGAGQPLAQLADLTTWQVETEDLTEFGVVRVREGAAAVVQIDALPDLSLAGHVASIQAIGKTRQGDVVYKVIVVPDQLDPRLRWGMSAQVSIETEER